MFQIKFVEKLKILCSIIFSENIDRTGHATTDNMAHALCMLHSKATDTQPEYVLLIAFPRHQLFPRTQLSISL